MRAPLLAAVLALAPVAAGAGVDARIERVGTERLLVHEADVAAPAADVWQWIASAEGWKSWAVPSAWMDFRRGGEVETSYDPTARRGDPANIRTRILAYVPGRMIALQSEHAPPDFPFKAQLPGLFSVFEIEANAGGGTQVRLTGVGYGEGEAFDRMLAFFEAGNRWSLERLVERAEKGPVDWTTVLSQQGERE